MSKEYIDLMIKTFIDELKYFKDYFNVIRAEIDDKGKRVEAEFKSISIDPNKVVLGDKLEQFLNLVDIFPEIKTLSSYKKLNELRLVCNVFKHGTGKSMTQ